MYKKDPPEMYKKDPPEMYKKDPYFKRVIITYVTITQKAKNILDLEERCAQLPLF